MKQYEAVVETMKRLGGIATLGQLYQEVFKLKECQWKTKTPFASVRRIVQQTPKEIYKIKPGLYGLVSHRKQLEAQGFLVETEKNRKSKAYVEFSHSYYQGLLLTMGNLKKLNTFAPAQDKNRKFMGTELGSIQTLPKIPPFSYERLVQRSSTIDVIWFNAREMPHSFFEVEYSTDICNALGKYMDLCDFNVRMIIVADAKRKMEYSDKIGREAYKTLRHPVSRVSFLDYDSLCRQYERELELQTCEVVL